MFILFSLSSHLNNISHYFSINYIHPITSNSLSIIIMNLKSYYNNELLSEFINQNIVILSIQFLTSYHFNYYRNCYHADSIVDFLSF